VVGALSVVKRGATLQNRAVLGAMSVAPSGSVLEEGGIYVGVKTPVKIYQQQPSVDGPQKETSNDRAKVSPSLAPR
jgi:carbonic anhydrase/acetyltransferase-like protein (isoleucine patch superfamily)